MVSRDSSHIDHDSIKVLTGTHEELLSDVTERYCEINGTKREAASVTIIFVSPSMLWICFEGGLENLNMLGVSFVHATIHKYAYCEYMWLSCPYIQRCTEKDEKQAYIFDVQTDVRHSLMAERMAVAYHMCVHLIGEHSYEYGTSHRSTPLFD